MKLNQKHLWAVLIAALLVRLLSLGAFPLMDTTEARYGEMARLMAETGNWITPQFDYGVPFWGKPPLFTWMSAAGIELFGLNEFAVRFPHWLAGVMVIALLAKLARRNGYNPLVTATVIATCGVFLISAGAVMTDMALTLGLSLAMVGFYRCWQGKLGWGYAGFVGLAIGLLAKGPLTIVLFGLAVMPWLWWQHGFWSAFKVLWQRFPVVTGTILMLVIALPWYLLAEKATPGFLDYFIVGEHYKRFVVSGWEGDLYGNAHDEPRGTIWLFWLQSALPWSLALLPLLWRNRSVFKKADSDAQPLYSFLLLWMISPLVLFTFSGNILPAYVLPGLPAMGLLIAMLIQDGKVQAKWLVKVSAIAPVLLVLAVIYINLGKGDSKSDRVLFEHADSEVTTLYIQKLRFSGQFYSRGKAKLFTDENQLDGLDKVQLIGKSKYVDPFIAERGLDCKMEDTPHTRRKLYYCDLR